MVELLHSAATQDEPLTVILENDDLKGPLRQLIASHQGLVRFQRGHTAEIRIPARQLASLLKRLPDNVTMRLPYSHQAVAMSERVDLIGAGYMRALQQSGAGVKIGVIDLGFSNYQSA